MAPRAEIIGDTFAQKFTDRVLKQELPFDLVAVEGLPVFLPRVVASAFRQTNMSLSSDPTKWTLGVLQSYCSANGLKKSGKKADVLGR